MKEGQWYPGNMARAANHLRRDLKAIDLVVELLDARVPESSRNPALAGMLKGKKHLLLLHKADRAEEGATRRWLSYFQGMNVEAMAFSVNEKRYLKNFFNYLKRREEKKNSARFKRPLRMMVVGIPNVGKSTLINYFVRKAVTRTGNQPGITRGRQWIRIMPGLELLDTPGILWPGTTEDVVYPLAAVGAIPAGRVDLPDIALWLIRRYREKNKLELLLNRYRDVETGEAEKIFERIAVSQGCLQAGGKVDAGRTAALLLRDFQAGSLGRLTLEEPPVS